MEAIAGVGTIIYKINTLIMALMMLFGNISSPATSDRIRDIDETPEMRFVVWGDTQVCNYNPEREMNYISAVDDLGNTFGKIDALTVLGDVAENGFQSEYDSIKDDLDDIQNKVDHFVMVTGNHDIRIRDFEQSNERFFDLMNTLNEGEKQIDSPYYTYEINGYKLLVMGSDEMRFEDCYVSEAQFTWLEEELKACEAEGKPAFVLSHYPFKNTHGLPNTWGTSLWESGHVGDQNDRILELLDKYENVFYLTGHLHTGIGQYTYDEIGEDIHGINVPSIGITNKDGVYNNAGTGLVVEVYEDKVVCRARDFSNGFYLTDADTFDENGVGCPAVVEYDVV